MKALVAWFDSVAKIAGGLTAVVALASAAVGLYFVLQPKQPSASAQFDPKRLKQFGPPTTLRSYLILAGQPGEIKKYTKKELATEGIYYTVPVTLDGLHTSHPNVVWSVFAATKNNSPIDQWADQYAGPVPVPRDHYVCLVRVWVQMPEQPGRYIAVIELDLGNQALDSVTTHPFARYAVASAPVQAAPPEAATPPPLHRKPARHRPTKPPPVTTVPPTTVTAPTKTLTTPTKTTTTSTTVRTTTTTATTTSTTPRTPFIVRPPVIITPIK